MKVNLVTHTPNPLYVVSLAASLCYKANRIMSTVEKQKLVANLIARGHMSPLEHVSFTFQIDGISRACSHQLVRHRIASYTQASQRYSKTGCSSMVIPISIMDSKDAGRVDDFMGRATELYEDLIASGISKEDARSVLPQATTTSIIVTMNARELIHFFEMRCDIHAQQEIRTMAAKMLKLVYDISPDIFQKTLDKFDNV